MTLLAGNFAFNAAAGRVVSLGADKGATGTDNSSPYDARAAFRLNYNSGTDPYMETGISPAGGGAIVSWTDRGNIAIPSGYSASDYEFQWVEITDEGGMTLTVTDTLAQSTWQDLDKTYVWQAVRTLTVLKEWVFDVTVRHKVNTSDTDTVQITLGVEGL